jgi:hypothetical protein
MLMESVNSSCLAERFSHQQCIEVNIFKDAMVIISALEHLLIEK